MKRAICMILAVLMLLSLGAVSFGEGVGDLSKGSVVSLGHFEQDNDTANGAEEIEWIVLNEQEGRLLLISRYALESRSNGGANTDLTWENNNNRAWLNGSFLEESFSAGEQSVILTTTVSYNTEEKIGVWEPIRGNDTQDRVFLLSASEVGRLFNSESDRVCQPTAYARAKGLESNCEWWTRTFSSYEDHRIPTIVDNDGSFSWLSGDSARCGVRPALWVDKAALLRLLSGDTEDSADQDYPDGGNKPAEDFNGVGNIILFGRYEQDGNTANGAEDIEWIVLDELSDSVLLLSRCILDSRTNGGLNTDLTWENNGNRTWLNESFLNEAFNGEEQNAIMTSTRDESAEETIGVWEPIRGNNVEDRVFLLSCTEAKKYFPAEEDRSCAVTKYAQGKGLYADSDGYAVWLLRTYSLYNGEEGAATVRENGKLGWIDVDAGYQCGIRPAVWVDKRFFSDAQAGSEGAAEESWVRIENLDIISQDSSSLVCDIEVTYCLAEEPDALLMLMCNTNREDSFSDTGSEGQTTVWTGEGSQRFRVTITLPEWTDVAFKAFLHPSSHGESWSPIAVSDRFPLPEEVFTAAEKDAEPPAPAAEPTGDFVIFGHYEQDGNTSNGAEEIEWIVLDEREDSLLLLSRYALDVRTDGSMYTDLTWENNDNRFWLNMTFLDEAFSQEEQEGILMTTIRDSEEENVGVWEPIRGSDTEDQVFLLSATEAERYFVSDGDRICHPSAFAKAKGLAEDCGWWLRTFSSYQEKDLIGYAVKISEDGGLTWSESGANGSYGIRPAMWVKKDAINLPAAAPQNQNPSDSEDAIGSLSGLTRDGTEKGK